MTMTEINEVVEYHSWHNFEPHPNNMRRIYPRQAVEQMAQSIRANAKRGGPGIIQPLLGCRVNGKIRIYAGNLRWHGAAFLGNEAPPVPVIIRSADELDQMLDMAVENKVRFDPDPLSEAQHFKALLDVGLSKARIARELGVSTVTIGNRLKILDLPEEVQQLFAEGRLPRLAAESLLQLEPDVQVAAAQFLSDRGTSLAVIKEICQRIAEEASRAKQVEPASAPALSEESRIEPTPESDLEELAEESSRRTEWEALSDESLRSVKLTLTVIPPIAPVPFEELEILVRATCAACMISDDIKDEILWEDMRQASRSTCRNCEVRGLRDICRLCPLPDFLKRLHKVLEVRHVQ